MRFSSAARLSFGLALASSAAAKVWDIQVGDASGSLEYSPEAIFADVGDQVVFHFHQKNHTATQSSFAAPCSPLAGGLDSGFMPVPANQTDNFPTWTVTVKDTKPLWFHCEQAANTAASHCGKGMVFAVNCGPDGSANSFTSFKKAALQIGAQLQAQASAAASSDSSQSTQYGYGSGSSGGYGYGGGSGDASSYTTADYGTATIPAEPSPVLTTETVTVETSSWVTVYSSYIGSPDPTPSSLTGNVIKVVVGGSNGELTFSPDHVQAAPRDVIQFEFHQKNHTATQSSFAAPCLRLKDAQSGNVVGLDSGFMPVAADATEFPTWNVTVNDTAPLWFYCRQHKPDGSSHCGAGMVFAVNAVESSARNFTAFKALAQTLNGTASTGNGTAGATGTGNGTDSGSGNGNNGAGVARSMSAALSLGALVAAAAVLL
ncbi:hypothetical protein C8Q77DRAFT_1213873 [Trametes polyzona]|nr:hypothetical protein C8Q77DRAFT_1213873 [Trametes polyzona]